MEQTFERAYAPWTPEEEDRVLMYHEVYGYSPERIARLITPRSPAAIRARLTQMGTMMPMRLRVGRDD